MSIVSSIQALVSASNPTIPPANVGVGYRPPIWGSSGSDPTGSQARYCLVYQDILTNNTNSNVVQQPTAENPVLVVNNVSQPTTVYNVFDATLRGRFETSLRITDYPIQSGQIYSYNAVLEPLRIELEIGMSDSMQSYIPTNFTGNESRSVAAFQLLQYLQSNRIFCTLNTRWGNFAGLLIEHVSLDDSNQTYASARFSVMFRQVQISQVANITQSTRPQSTQAVNGGNSSSQDVPQSVATNNQIPALPSSTGSANIYDATDAGNLVTVAAGNYSSNNISTGVFN